MIEGLEARRRQLENLAAVTGGNHDFEGHVPLGSGESISEVPFDVEFRELPLFTFGFSLGDNETYELGAFPTGSAVATFPYFRVDRQTTARIYTGARILWVTAGGRPDAQWLGHFRFTGRILIAT